MNKSDSQNQIPLGTGNNSTLNKIPLSEFHDLRFNGSISMFRLAKENNPHLSSQIRLRTKTIAGFKHDYQKDEMTPENFCILAYSSDTVGFEMDVTEEMLEKMLEYVRSEKKKVYCFEGSQ